MKKFEKIILGIAGICTLLIVWFVYQVFTVRGRDEVEEYQMQTIMQETISEENIVSEEPPRESQLTEVQKQPFILPEGETLQTRFAVPEGYERMEAEEGSLAAFLRGYEMKPDGSPVLLYDGSKKRNHTSFVVQGY